MQLPLCSSVRIAFVTATVIAFLGGCGGETSTSPVFGPLLVSTTVEQPVAKFADTPDGPTITCDVAFVSTATGSGYGTWTGITFRLFAGANRSVPVDSIVLGPGDVASSMGQSTISSTLSPQVSPWRFFAGGPFEVESEFRYTVAGGGAASAKARFACGAPPLPGAPAPTVGSLAVNPASGTVQPGDTLTVTYSAASTSGLWSTIVDVSGGFDAHFVVSEKLLPSSTRSLRVPVPRGSKLGASVSITVYATDGAFQEGHRALATSLTVADVSAPVLTSAFTSANAFYQTELPYRLGGQFAVGDTLSFEVFAKDNDVIDQLLFDIAPAGVHDSIRAPAPPSPGFFHWIVKLPVKPEWAGNQLLTLRVRDHAGLLSSDVTSPADSLRFFTPAPHNLTSLLAVPNAESILGDLRYDEKRKLLYVGQPSAKAIAVLVPSTMTFEKSITFPTAAWGTDLTLTGDSLLVALPFSKSIAVVALDHRDAAPAMIAMPMLDSLRYPNSTDSLGPMGLRVMSNGKALVGLSGCTKNFDVLAEVDLSSGAQRIRTEMRNLCTYGGSWPFILERTRDRSKAAFFLQGGCARTYRAATDDFTSCTMVNPDNSRGLSYDESGNVIAYGSSLRDGQFAQQRPLPRLAGNFQHMVLSPDATLAYVLTTSGYVLTATSAVTVVRLSDGTLLDRVLVPFAGSRLALLPGNEGLLVFSDPNYSPTIRDTRVMKIGPP